jgi:hypothetical protein
LIGNGGNSFISYLSDSFFVLILAALLIKEPLKIIKESFIEVAAGSLYNNTRNQFESIIEKKYLYISN